jgi:serine/threonine protein phosphatase PrpC
MSRTRSPQAAAATDPGRERSNNEDRVLCEPDLGIFAVIDGVGGESAGEVAAETALEVLRARLSRRTTDSARLVREAIALANRQIYERASSDARLTGMSCVLTVAVLDGAKVTVGQVGDSRLYTLAPGEIRKVTPDHSPVGAREDAGDLSELEAMRHPRRNEIFRDVGSGPHEPDDARWIDVLEVPFDAGGALLLCSDGLSDMLPSQEILETVENNAASPRAAVRALIERANAAGGKDNVSAVLVEGERFAEAVRRRRDGSTRDGGGRAGRAASAAVTNRPPGGAARTSATSLKPGSGSGSASGPGSRRGGAAWARPSTAERLKDSLPALLGKSLLVVALLLAAFAAYRYREPLVRWVESLAGRRLGAGGGRGTPGVLVVGTGDGGFATIGEALAQARPGETVEVAPGQYRERIALRSGVSLVSRTPRGATLLPPPPGPAGTPETREDAGGGAPMVTASAVHGARLAGFRITGTPRAPLAVGLRLDGSEVVVEEVEVTGAAGAGIESRGDDRSTVRYCYVHHNAGPGITAGGDAAPRLLSNLILGNGTRPGALAPGVEVRGAATPLLADNRIEGNGGAGVVLPAPDRSEEVFRWNSFGAVPREQAVRVAAGAAPAGAGRALAGRTVAARPPSPAGTPAPTGAAPSAASRAPRRQP